MKPGPVAVITCLSLASLATSPAGAQSVDVLFEAFWAAESNRVRQAAAGAIAGSDIDFSTAYHKLADGRTYEAGVETGRLDRIRYNTDGQRHPYVVLVPDSYDPAKRYPLRMYLHGGVRRPAWDSGGGWWRNYDPIASEDYIAVVPASWIESMWWQASQVENVSGILADLKRTYNIDENRLYMFGVSDGGTGAYFFAFKDATPWAGFFPFIAHPAVLSNPKVTTDGDMHMINLANRPLFIANGEEDRLYPVRSMEPFLDAFESAGVEFTFNPQEGGHSVRWWPAEARNIEAFITSHPRSPLPEHVVWEVERTDRYNRMAWLRIDELGSVAGEAIIDEYDAFLQSAPSGRVEAQHVGNDISVFTRGVRRFSLLISPDQFDLSKPIRVITNGNIYHNRLVDPDLNVLLEWAACDQDRTMLFAAEIAVDLSVDPR